MKRFLNVCLLFLFGISFSYAQINLGVEAGVPVGDVSDRYEMNLGLNMYYMFGDSPDGLLKFGAVSGFTYYADKFGGGGTYKDALFIPIAGVLRINLLKIVTFGPDIGYAFALDDIEIMEDKSGGFYWKLVAGVHLGRRIELNAFYHSEMVGANFSTIGLGGYWRFGE